MHPLQVRTGASPCTLLGTSTHACAAQRCTRSSRDATQLASRRAACFGTNPPFSLTLSVAHQPQQQPRQVSGLNVRCQVTRAEHEIYTKTAAKALEINLNPQHYGVLAEIGAGQEVARWFFRVGGAAGTIAKSISAYDMTISDTTYGSCKRYVTRERLEAMLDFEYLQCDLTLRSARGDNTAFFAFADTVVAKAYNRNNECHGWLGIKYQSSPRTKPNQVLIHVRMLDKTAQAQAEALGILGVNLVHAALTRSGNHYDVISALLDDLSRDRVEVDVADFSGPDFKHVDNRYAALNLVQKGCCDAALFSPAGVMQIPQEALRKKNVLIVRGRFRPFTLLHNDMLQCAAGQFFCEDEDTSATSAEADDECVFRDDTLVLLEMTTRDMMEAGDLLDWTSDKGIQEEAFASRIDALATMGYTVLVSNFRRYFKLASYVSTFTDRSIVIAMGVPSLKELFNERHYADLEGGILEGFGRLLKYDLKIYGYPTLDEKTGELITAERLQVAPGVQLLYDYIRQRGTIVPITDFRQELLMHADVSRAVSDSIRAGTDLWETLVPKHVAEEIKSKHLLGYRPRPPAAKSNGSATEHTNSNGKPAGLLGSLATAGGAKAAYVQPKV